jgi:hypothetical protein
MSFSYRFLTSIAVAATLLAASTASTAVISNGIPSGTLGHWSVDVGNGGESNLANLTANRLASGDIFTEDVLFDYYTYVDVGNGGFRLSSTLITTPVNVVGNTATSSGAFLGADGTTAVNWTAESTIAPGGSIFETTFSFESDGPLGDLRLYQYLDEDIEAVSDDVFFTRGSAAGLDLELFTVDNTEVYGVSHSGALDGAQGLQNAEFTGWAANDFNSMKPAIEAGLQSVSLLGIIDPVLTPFNHPQIGSAYGPDDIVSVMAWTVDPDSSIARIITTLGGVPDVTDIPPNGVPEPATTGLLFLGVVGLAVNRRRRR